ncbi:hypothetical protein [Streptomyces cremeus]|uniref:DUF4232 domain-containing protein n=1 Tax=Streptomyces cremeus TaxID=66881 RepID=A0ABV5PI69_STRCM
MSGSDQERHGPDGPRTDRTGKNRAVNDGRDGREERHGRENPAHPRGDSPDSRTGAFGDRGTTSWGADGDDRGTSWGSDGGDRGTSWGADGGDKGTSWGADGGAFPAGAFPGGAFPARNDGGSSPGTGGPSPARDAFPGPRRAPAPTLAFPAPGPQPAGAALSPDELAIRRLMQGAVHDLKPADGALDQLRRAVPLRRTRRRQAVVGAAAAALLIGTAIPAFLHVSRSDGSTTAHSANAGHSQSTEGSDGDRSTGTGSDGTGQGPADPQGKTPGKTTGKDPGGASRPPAPGVPDTGQNVTEGSDEHRPDAYEQSGDAPGKPACDGDQLQVIQATTGAPDATGKVYGAFRIANKSGAECTVPGEGRMKFQAMGAADQKRIKVVEHKQGDPAVGLPDPAKEARSLVLPPEAAYEVQFAWVPQDTCPSTNDTTPEPTPTGENPGASGTVGGTPGGEPGGKVPEPGPEDAKSTGTTTQLLTGDGDPADGKVAVTHTPEEGAPSAATTIPNACAGTIYRTGVLDAP